MAYAKKVGDVVLTRNGTPFTVTKIDGETMEVIKPDGTVWKGLVTDMKLDEGQGNADAVNTGSGRRSRNAKGSTHANHGGHWFYK